SLSSPPVLSTAATANSSPGIFPIHVSDAQDTNYTIQFVDGTLTILPGATTALVTSSANPSLPGQAVSFGVVLGPVAPAVGLPGGTVQFKIDGPNAGLPALLTGGAASFTTATLLHGQHSVAIQY